MCEVEMRLMPHRQADQSLCSRAWADSAAVMCAFDRRHLPLPALVLSRLVLVLPLRILAPHACKRVRLSRVPQGRWRFKPDPQLLVRLAACRLPVQPQAKVVSLAGMFECMAASLFPRLAEPWLSPAAVASKPPPVQ